jgi:VWFA-related protein
MHKIARCASWIATSAMLFAAPVLAEVVVRIQSRPPEDPIKVFVEVTTANGQPIGNLTDADFGLEIDAQAPSNAFVLTQPPFTDPSQRLSVIFAIDYSSSVHDFFIDAIEAGVSTFIDNMVNGDYAAILKFNNTLGVSVVQPFTLIDGGNGETQLVEQLLLDYDGLGTNLIDALVAAAGEFENPGVTLPDGPKAVILISDGDDNSSDLSQSDAIAALNAAGVAVFSVSVGDISGDVAATALMSSIAQDTGGRYFAGPDEAEIDAAYTTISGHLNNSYVLTLPQSEVTDCNEHTLDVLVQSQSASIDFYRCDTTPDDFHFVDATGVEPGVAAVSNVVTITGIDMATEIAVTGGEYSIGCTSSFTSAPGVIEFEDDVCVRHTAAAGFNAGAGPTVLVVGGVASSFRSTTRAAPPPDNGGGGGGAVGVLELLLGLTWLSVRRLASRP